MGKNHDEFDEIFEETDHARTGAGVEEMMEHLTEMMEAGRVDGSDALEALLNLMKPGATERSHDILLQFRAAMYALDFGEVAERVPVVWLTTFPWGIGFHFGFDEDYPVPAMSKAARNAVIRSLCAVLQAGGMKATLSKDNKILIVDDEGTEQSIHVEHVIAEFREELDHELGPDAPVPDASPEGSQQVSEWMKRWMKPE